MVQELESVAFESDVPVIVQGLGCARDLGRIELLVFVRWERCVHMRHECRDRQVVRGGISCTEKVDDRVACET